MNPFSELFFCLSSTRKDGYNARERGLKRELVVADDVEMRVDERERRPDVFFGLLILFEDVNDVEIEDEKVSSPAPFDVGENPAFPQWLRVGDLDRPEEVVGRNRQHGRRDGHWAEQGNWGARP